MVIDGKGIAETILIKLSDTVATLKKSGITPALAVILVGDDPGSLSYIRQKQKAAERIGAKLLFEHFPDTISPVTLASAIAHYNNDQTVHGIIIQRPVPQFIGEVGDILNSVTSAKDVDGFLPDSPFEVPVARAVVTILQHIHDDLRDKALIQTDFMPWIQGQCITVLGRGETAGKPIAELLAAYACSVSVINSKTPDPEKIIRQSDIVISCVGKPRTITRRMIRSGTVLISVGLSRSDDGKLHGDYEADDIQESASFYTPTPGGVGPVNVASLMHNLVDACIMAVQKSNTFN